MKPIPLKNKRRLIAMANDRNTWLYYIIFDKSLWIKAMQMLNPGWLSV